MARALQTPSSLPSDVRLMHAGAQLLLVLAVLAVLASTLAWVARSPVFSLRQIRIEGDVAHNSAATIRNHAVPLLAGSYFSMNLREARQAFETVPWVRHAQVRRIWPHQLLVTLEEHQPVAYWERVDADPLLVNNHGEVFEVNLGDVEEDALPVLRGPNGSAAQVWAMWQRLAPEFERLGARMLRLALSDGGSWQARLDKAHAVIELGRGEPEEVLQRTRRFTHSVTEISARFENRLIEYADLRHSESYALRLVGMGTLDPTQIRKGR
jgi:cell division protein FtsQ